MVALDRAIGTGMISCARFRTAGDSTLVLATLMNAVGVMLANVYRRRASAIFATFFLMIALLSSPGASAARAAELGSPPHPSSIAAWVTQESDGKLPAIQVHSKAAKSETSAYGPGGRLLQKGNLAFEYDAKGRRTAKVKTLDDGALLRTEYEWDGRDRLRSIKKPDGTILRYSYDAFGRRVSKTLTRPGQPAERTAFVWDGEVLALELSATEGPRAFVHEPGTFEPFLQEQGGRIYLSVNDHLGMPKELVTTRGEIAWSAAHSAYGKVLKTHEDGSGASSPFRLLGQLAEEAEIPGDTLVCRPAVRLVHSQ